MKAPVHGDVVVLLVDDDPLMNEELAAGLSGCGFHVFTATDVASAIRQETLHQPHVILFDIKLLGGKGLNVWRVLRDMSRDTRSVMYSASATAIDGFQARELGVDAVLLKPASIDEVAGALRNAVFGPVTADPVDVFCRDLHSSTDAAFAPAALLPRVVHLLGDVKVELFEFGRLAEISKTLTLPSAGSRGPTTIRRYFDDLAEVQRSIPPHLRDLLHMIANSVENLAESHDWPVDVRSELHSKTGRWPHSWLRIARLRRGVHELVRTHEQVAQIAVQLGFSCGGRLCHDLHELIGLSPTQLRKLQKASRRK